MDHLNYLSKTSRKDLDRLKTVFSDKTKKTMPDETRIKEWKALDNGPRFKAMYLYFEPLMRGGQYGEAIRDTVKDLRRLDRRRNLSRAVRLFFLVLACLISLKWFEFRNLPRVYAIGSGISVSLSDGSLNEFSFQEDGTASLVQTGMAGDTIQVCADRFLPWVLGRSPMGTVSAVDFVRTTDSIERFEAIFADMEGTSYLNSYGSAARRKIFNILHKDPNRDPRKIIAESSPPPRDTQYALPFYFYQPPTNQLNECLFVSVECEQGNFNLRYILNPNGTLLQVDAVALADSKLVKGSLMWKKPQQRDAPEICFTDRASYYRYRRPDAPIAVPLDTP